MRSLRSGSNLQAWPPAEESEPGVETVTLPFQLGCLFTLALQNRVRRARLRKIMERGARCFIAAHRSPSGFCVCGSFKTRLPRVRTNCWLTRW
jgi:hypothetical protein